MKEIILEIKNLSCGYDSQIILSDINLTVEKGKLLGIIGPNGSGKTTLLRAITGVIRPKEGNIFFEDKDIYQIGLKELAKKIAVVPQSIITNSMTVEEFVLLGRIPHYKKFQFFETKKDQEIVRKAFELTDTFKLKNRSILEISSGERQLVLIARALAQEPKLLLLDEPTAHLDIGHQIKIMNLIKKLNEKEGLTVLVVLHDLNLASQYCEELVLLNEGKIIRQGSVNEVLNYRDIEKVYKTTVLIKENPLNKRPFVILFPPEGIDE
jgi:iron complex transport system ATP-binding protein